MHFEGWDDAQKALRAFESPRSRRLRELESWAHGTQYVGKPSWWDDRVPLWEREPCFVYPIVRTAIESNIDLVLGEGRFPAISSKPGENEAEEDGGLSEDDSAALDRFIVEYHKLCRFKSHAREAFWAAQACGTAVALHGVRDGKPFAETIPARWAIPTLTHAGRVETLRVQYAYLDEYRKANGKWAVRARLYRRDLDSLRDVTYFPADIEERTSEDDIAWVEDPAQSITHSLGFCPAIWYPFMRGCVPINVIDGKAIHAGLSDEIYGHDIAVSQRHRCALMTEPQVVEIGVTPGENPTDMGRLPRVEHMGGPIDRSADGFSGNLEAPGTPTGTSKGGVYVSAPRAPTARKKGPGYVWQYTDPNTRVSYLAIGSEALKAQDDNIRDLRVKLMDTLAVVLMDPESVRFAASLSGKALMQLKQRQIDRCDQYRDDLDECLLRPSVEMQLRIAQKVGGGLRVPGTDKVLKVLDRGNTANA